MNAQARPAAGLDPSLQGGRSTEPPMMLSELPVRPGFAGFAGFFAMLGEPLSRCGLVSDSSMTRPPHATAADTTAPITATARRPMWRIVTCPRESFKLDAARNADNLVGSSTNCR